MLTSVEVGVRDEVKAYVGKAIAELKVDQVEGVESIAETKYCWHGKGVDWNEGKISVGNVDEIKKDRLGC